jgi:hypothetical protein
MGNTQNNEEDLKISDSKIDLLPVKLNKRFVEKNYDSLKWGISIYHLFFSLWATYKLFQILLQVPNDVLYTIPVIIFIVTSTLGGILLLKGKSNAYNYLIAAQIPQVIVFQLNTFVYFLLIGQWIILRVGGPGFFGINFGILEVKYACTFLQVKQNFLIGINLVPLILIFILLKMEEMEQEMYTSLEAK